MVKVANDEVRIDGDLTSPLSEAPVSGVPLRVVVGLPGAQDASVLASPSQLEAPIIRTCALSTVLPESDTTRSQAHLRHHLVIADASEATAALRAEPDLLDGLATAGAAALALTGDPHGEAGSSS